MDTKDFRGVALNPYYEFSVEVPLSNYGVRFEDYQKAFQAGFRRAHRYWDGIEDVTVVSETPTLLVRRLHFGGGASATDCIEGSGERFTHWILDTEGKVHGRNEITLKRNGEDARVTHVCSLVPSAKLPDERIEAIREKAYRAKDEAFALGVLADLLEERDRH